MDTRALNDFHKEQEVSDILIQKYSDKLPAEIIDIWKEYGFGTFMGGYLKLIDPDEYIPLLKKSYFLADVAIPFLLTAFGDIITWEKNQYIGIVFYRYGRNEIMIRSPQLFFTLLSDTAFLKKYFTMNLYRAAVAENGALAYDECFSFTPILALGGSEKLERIQKAKIREHVSVMYTLGGGIM